MTAINVFDITDELLDQLFPRRLSGPDRDASAPGVELCLVRGYVRAAPTPRRDSYGIRTDQARCDCPRCGFRYSAANPEVGDTCRDCADVVGLIDVDEQGWCNDTCA